MEHRTCVLCDRLCDQPGRFCSVCVGRRGLVARTAGDVEVGPARIRVLRLLQWPISLLLLGATAVAGMRTAALVLDLSAVLRKRAVQVVDLHHLAAVEQRLVLAGAALIGVVGALWLLWWAVAYTNLRPLGVRPRHHGVWAVVAWVVPLADLIVPQRVADELWTGSDPWTPLGWRQARYARRSPAVRLWWTSWLGASVALAAAQAAVSSLSGRPTTVTVVADGCLIASAVLTAVAGLSGIHLVTGVTARQGERARMMIEAGLV
jgi:uncharacterized protein DUF4328